MATFPSVEAMMMVFPDDDGPNSSDRSTFMVRMLPSTFISTFFIYHLLLVMALILYALCVPLLARFQQRVRLPMPARYTTTAHRPRTSLKMFHSAASYPDFINC